MPDGGKLIDLQAYYRGGWRTFATPRTDRRGRWSYRYRFGATRGTVRYRFRARSGRTYRLRQIGCLVGDEMHDEPDRQAMRLLFAGRSRGFDELREANRAAWADIWFYANPIFVRPEGSPKLLVETNAELARRLGQRAEHDHDHDDHDDHHHDHH